MESYIVRVYRRRPRLARKLAVPAIVGLVEAADRGDSRAFHSPQELWSILLEGGAQMRRRGPKRAR
jgi:hypothetical protein